ncbi:capsule assembly Wzi family protein [Catalinimonas sp. 4WD22]|uniref:capsule assembly Wzi family protein n=1 Tax=Catalinimonas locisalis TaxID=3133978 RepID=UPI003101A91A
MNRWKNYKKNITPILIIALYFGLNHAVRAQFLDSLKVKVGTSVTIAKEDYQPLWLVSNRWGTITDQKFDASTYLTLSNHHTFGGKGPIRQYYGRYTDQPTSNIIYGVSINNHNHFKKTFLSEAYAKVKWHALRLDIGRYKEVVGEVDYQLSSGSLGISGNALPIPKVSLAIPSYTDVPFIAPGWIQVKGQFSNGWMDSDSLVSKAYLHQRSFYVRLGKKPLVNARKFTTINLYGGLNQFVVWGGESSKGNKLPGEWIDIFTKAAVPGNNLGFFDYGATLTTRDFNLTAYTQVPFESKTNMNPFRIKNRLVGVSWTNHQTDAILSALTFEAINTTWQDNTSPTGRADYNFYNNERYTNGWTYQGNIIGTPLFFDYQRATHYFGESYNSQAVYNIANNRINGFHIGVKGYFPTEWFSLSYRTLFTYTINNGNYNDSHWVAGDKKQSYFMQELNYKLNGLKVSGTLAFDVGKITSNVGGMLAIEYDLNYKPDLKELGPVRFRRKINPFKRR